MDTTSPHALKFPRDHRRRSADVGGLHLALASAFAAAEVQLAAHDHYNPSLDGNDQDLDNEDYTYGYHPHHRHPYHHHHQQFGARGQGWMGGEGGDIETMYAELLSDMYNETLNSLNDNSLDTTPPPVPENVRTRLIWQLDKWHFEPHKLPDEEVLACTLLLFEALFRVEGMEEVIPLSMDQITAFIHHLRRIYRHENKYHNFEHALDVLQATQSYLKSAGVVPPPTILFQPPGTRWVPKRKVTDADADVDSGSGSEQSLMATLGKRELFILYVGAIGHDAAHPGFSNVFMKNAQAPLAILFNHGSALEHMHSHLLLALMRRHGFAPLLDDPLHGSHLRKLLKEAVLATDMGVHGEFMDRLEGVVRGEQMSLCARQVVLCQALLKNADISNPTRPFLVSKHWSSALIQEWTAQAHLETYYHLQPTVPVSTPPPSVPSHSPSPPSSSTSSTQPEQPLPPPPDPLAEANSQIFFIKKFAKPLLELTERAVPEMGMYTRWCKANLRTWEGVRAGVVREREREAKEREERAHRQARRKAPVEEQRSQEREEVLTVNGADVELVVDDDPSTPASSSVSLQSSPIPPRLAHMHSQSQLQYHTAFPLTLPPHPLSSYAYSLSNTHSSASSSSGRSRSGHSHSNNSGHANSQTPSPALSVPDSPTTTEASECRSAASSSSFSLANSNSEASTALGAASHSVLSFAHSIGIGGGTSTNAATASLAIRAAGKVGALRKKSQTGLNAGAMGGVSRMPPMPPLPAVLGASLSTSSTSGSGGGGGAGTASASSSGAASPKILGPSLSFNGLASNGTNGTSANLTDTLNGSSSDKTPKNKSHTNGGAGKMSSFRFGSNSRSRTSARNSWCASSLTGLYGNANGVGSSSSSSTSTTSAERPESPDRPQDPERPKSPERPRRRAISPLPPGKESWLGASSSGLTEEQVEEDKGKGKDTGKEKGKEKDKEKEDVETTPTATRVASSMPSSSSSHSLSECGGLGEGQWSGRTSPSPSPRPPPAPAPLVSARGGRAGVGVQVSP